MGDHVEQISRFMLPILKAIEDEREYTIANIVRAVSNDLGLSKKEREEIMSSSTLRSNLSWAKTHLKYAGLVEYTKSREVFKITQHGLKVLKNPPSMIDRKYLRRNFDPYKEQSKKLENHGSDTSEDEMDFTDPNEAIDRYTDKLRNALHSDLRDEISKRSPKGFVDLTLDLLGRIYGGAVEAGKQTRDGGIDGTIQEDELGLNKIYIQCKRYKSDVTAKDVRDFLGALHSKSTKKGIFITSSEFTPDAKKSIENLKTDASVVLVDGLRLAELMDKNGIGVSTERSISINNLDQDHFDRFEKDDESVSH